MWSNAGEDLANSDGEDDAEAEGEEEAEGFVVPDGTFSDDEGIDGDASDRLVAKSGFKVMDITVICDVSKLESVTMIRFGDVAVDEAPSRYDTDENGRNVFKEAEKAKKDEETQRVKAREKEEKLRMKSIQSEMLPDLVRIVHGQTKPMPKIQEEFKALYPAVGKDKITEKVKEIAVKQGRTWRGTDNGMLEACGLSQIVTAAAVPSQSPSPFKPELTEEQREARRAERKQREAEQAVKEAEMDRVRMARFKEMDEKRKANDEVVAAEKAATAALAREKKEKFSAAVKEKEAKKKLAALEKEAEAKPKKLSAYALFSKEKKPELQEKNPSKTGPEITTLIGALWKVRR